MLIRSVLSVLTVASVCLILAGAVSADVEVTTGISPDGSYFQVQSIPLPAVNDAGANGKWSVLEGRVDANSGSVALLSDGRVPANADQPTQNFFFAAGTDGGLIAVDLGQSYELSEIVTYSWHSDTRAPQVYSVYAAVGDEPGFAFPESSASISNSSGWKKIADVDSRTRNHRGGQHVARIFDTQSPLGNFRHLLFAVKASELDDPFGNTFFSEIDIVTGAAEQLQRITAPEVRTIRFASADDGYRFTIDVTQALELEEWTETELRPVIQEWYPRIVAMLPSEGFKAPRDVQFRYLPDSEMKGIPAYASGSTISMNAEWFRGQLNREARGAVVHEMVHIVQGYPGRNRRVRNVVAPPGWIVEGIPDYIRWFLYEPHTKGAQLTPQVLAKARHDASYRTSANFIDWVIRQYPLDGKLLEQLNAAARQGKYSPETWMKLTGKSEVELAEAWRTGS